MRYFLIAVCIFGGGIAFGWFVAPKTSRAESGNPRNSQSRDLERLKAQIGRLESERDRLTTENWDLMQEISELADEQAEREPAVEPHDEPAQGETVVRNTEEASSDAPEEARAGRRGWTAEDREQWDERRRVFEQRFNDALASEVAAMSDPATAADRLDAMLEWRDYQRDLRQDLRDAESDAEREAILAEMESARATARQLLREQQDALLRDLAESNGLRSERQQDAFIAAARETMQSPFFEMELLLIGGGFGRRGRPGGNFRASGN